MKLDNVLLCGIIIILVIMIAKLVIRENYATKHEKAETIFNWFQSASEPKYTEYKNAVPESDIIEYSDAKKLYKTNNFTVAKIAGGL